MTVEEALATLERILGQESLNEIQKIVFCLSWEQKSYPEIACSAGYDEGYVKHVGFQLWKTISAALNEKVTKNNFRSTLAKWRNRTVRGNFTEAVQGDKFPSCLTDRASETDFSCRQDWGEAIDVSIFYGRSAELAILERWIIDDRCRLVALLGIGGIGKTALSVKLAKQLQGQFDRVIWRSLHNAPAIESILASEIQFLSNQQNVDLPTEIGDRISLLLEYLQKHRCLLVFDNAETILRSPVRQETFDRHRTGDYRPGYEGYGELFRRIGESFHQSCLVLTSREKPKEVAILEGEKLSVRSLQLPGLTIEDGWAIFNSKGQFIGSDSEWQKLIQCYGGNPLALKIVATTVRDLFNGNIAQFLSQGTVVFGDIQDLIDQHFCHLSSLEKEVMHWLAIEREPVSITELQEDLLSPCLTGELLDALAALERRSLIEKSQTQFTLQPVLMEYMTGRLIKQIGNEIKTQAISDFKTYALMKAQAKDYIKETQINLILKPIAEQLLRLFGSAESVEAQLIQILSSVRGKLPFETGYAGGNAINLLCQFKLDFSGYDFSDLTIWQADLKGIYLRRADFSRSNLSKSTFTENFSHIYSLAVSPDGKLMAIADTTGEICLRSVSDGQLLIAWEAHIGTIRSISFSPDGQTLISGGDDQMIKWILPLNFSPDGRILAGGHTKGKIQLWNAETGERLKTLPGHRDTFLLTLCFSPDGLLISGGMDRMLRWWDIETGECLREIQAHQDWIWWVACSQDGKTLASCSADKTIKLWDLHTGQLLRILQGHEYGVRVVLFNSDGRTLIDSDECQTLKIWDLQTGQCLRTLRGYSSGVWAIAFSPDGRTLVSSGDDQTVRLWDVEKEVCLKILRGHRVWVRSVAFSPDGETVASCGIDCIVKFWNVRTGECLQTLRGHTSFIWAISFSPDGRSFASCSIDQSVRIWDVCTGQLLTVLDHSSPATAVIYSPKGQMLASYGFDHSLRLWDVQTGECLKVLQSSTDSSFAITLDSFCSLTFSPDERFLATSTTNHFIRVWDVVTGERVFLLPGHTAPVMSVAYSPDGRFLASSSMDRTVRIWDARTGQCFRVLEGHTKWVYSVRFTVLSVDS